jgi:hypothetical protein
MQTVQKHRKQSQNEGGGRGEKKRILCKLCLCVCARSAYDCTVWSRYIQKNVFSIECVRSAYIHIYTYIYTDMYKSHIDLYKIYTYVCMDLYISVYTDLYIRICRFIHTYIFTHTYVSSRYQSFFFARRSNHLINNKKK